MKHFIIKKTSLLLLLLIVFLGGMTSCKDMMSDYKKYTKGGEIIYAGKIDSVKIYSGKTRVLVKGLFIADPIIVGCWIYWDGRKDSVKVSIVKTAGVDTLRTFIDVAEGTHSFEIRTFDKFGNTSVPVYTTGTAYGALYQASLLNRPMIDLSPLDALGNVTISWGTMDKTSGVKSTFVRYTDVNGIVTEKKTPISDLTSVLPNYKSGISFQYRTAFIPDTLCIDTFYTEWKTRTVDLRINKTNWTATADCEELVGEGAINGRANAAIDDNINTYWHSTWKAANVPYPHWLAVDMKQTIIVNQVELTRRQGNNNSFNNFRIDGSMDGVNWIPYGSYTLIAGNTTQRFPLPGSHQMQYIRIYATSFTGGLNAHLAEFSVDGL